MSDHHNSQSNKYVRHHTPKSRNQYDKYNSRQDKTKVRSNNYNNNSENKSKRHHPRESSPFAFFSIMTFCTFIQIVFMSETKPNLSRPTENELPLAFMINHYFDLLPTFDFMRDLTDHPNESILASFIVFLIYRILCSTSQSPITSYLISFLFLFDETTYNLIATNPSFGIQLILMSICVIICQNLLVIQIFSSSWITCGILAIFLGFLATFISVDAFTIFIPITTSIILLSRSSDSRSNSSFCKKIFDIILASFYLIFFCSICLLIAFGAFLIGPPKFIVKNYDLDLFISEFLINRHNISFLFIAPIAIISFFFTDIEFPWLLSFIGCLIFTLVFGFSSVVNDLEVKVALSVYYYLLCCGIVLTNPCVSNVSSVILAVLYPIVFYFYKYPI